MSPEEPAGPTLHGADKLSAHFRRPSGTGVTAQTTPTLVHATILVMFRSFAAQAVFGIGRARWSGSPSPSDAAQGFDLIPVSGVDEVVGGVSEV